MSHRPVEDEASYGIILKWVSRGINLLDILLWSVQSTIYHRGVEHDVNNRTEIRNFPRETGELVHTEALDTLFEEVSVTHLTIHGILRRGGDT